MGREKALSDIDDYFLTGAFEADLTRRIGFRTESNLEGCDDALQGYLADELVPYLSSMDFDCTIHPNPRNDAGDQRIRRSEGRDFCDPGDAWLFWPASAIMD